MTDTQKKEPLYLSFHGRIIDSLGIQMYQSPVAAVAELIANAWDADATTVEVTLPESLAGASAEFVIKDDGGGMTYQECQDRYLKVGRNRRLDEGDRTAGGRPCLGRKGIGKFAGFGIAQIVEVDTTSADTGERTCFQLDLTELRAEPNGEFVGTDRRRVSVLVAEGPNADRVRQHGTTVRLRNLGLSRVPSAESFARSMAKRFLLAQQASNFRVRIDELDLPESVEPFAVELEFPRDYTAEEKPVGLVVSDGWGVETLPDGHRINWQFKFAQRPIGEEEFRGVAVYCGVKVAQTPFFFHLSGGLSGQHGQQYLSGKVRADYLDRLSADIITTERQRINWDDPNARTLMEWGQQRIKELLAIWKARRSAARVQQLEERVAAFGRRLSALPSTEAKIVKGALIKLASIETLDAAQFEDLGGALLTAWEGGRLRGIVENFSRMEEMDEGVLLGILAEENVLSALHLAEIVAAKVSVIRGLRQRIERRELENAIRDYIAKHPWLIDPQWETFKVETALGVFLRDARAAAGIDDQSETWRGRMDLVLRSGNQLLVLEFMRPGLTADRDHFNRFQNYIDVLTTRLLDASSNLKIQHISGILVADKLAKNAENLKLIERLRKDDMLCEEWSALLAKAESSWTDFLHVVVTRAPEDPRIQSLAKERAGSDASKEPSNGDGDK